MSTSFSTSLFGLSSSLIIGFLDLQAGHAQNRFYNELEEWLSSMTRLSSGGHIEGDTSVPAYVQALLEQTADGLERLQRSFVENEHERQAGNHQLSELTRQIERLGDLLSREARDRQSSAAVQDELRGVLKQLATQIQPESRLTDELRAEIRLMTRTMAAAIESRSGRQSP
jgi:septal ring factor EnvC (AmiA/AmiB activator)